jgi:hypothetical protein
MLLSRIARLERLLDDLAPAEPEHLSLLCWCALGGRPEDIEALDPEDRERAARLLTAPQQGPDPLVPQGGSVPPHKPEAPARGRQVPSLALQACVAPDFGPPVLEERIAAAGRLPSGLKELSAGEPRQGVDTESAPPAKRLGTQRTGNRDGHQ